MDDWSIPKSIKSLRGFLVLTTYYRKFIKNYGLILSFLTTLLRNDAFNWGSEAFEVFGGIEECNENALVLALSVFSTQFVIEFYAFGMEIGVVLKQGRRPLPYLDQTLGGKP